MAGQRRVQSVKKSSVPGVTITQFVEDIPKGCSTPDFERKPITLTLQEGKNAIFRAVVKGEPKPEVVWKRNNTSIDDPQKYQITFSPASNEFILQINKITADDADLYRCTAVNEYGEATCTAGLKIIQVGFKKKTKEASSARQGDLKKEIQDFRKTLKKRAPSVLPKKELDSEQVWQLLLHADKKDYERICLKYGIVDFRGMLRKLQEMKKEREDKQAQYISSITNLKHVRVNEEKGNASFDLEMELKNPESRIYLYKDGQMIHFGFDSDNAKHCLRKVGRKYNFIINNVQPEDAGVYQIKVEDVDIFSTELEEETIPMSFRNPLGDVRCHEQGNAVFQCTLYDACFDAVWLHKNCRLQPSDKYDISVSDDGLTHRLLIKNTELSDKGTYTIDVGSRSSSAWLEIESAKGKRKQAESDSDKAGWKNKLLEDGAKKLRQGEGHEDQDSHSDFSMGKDGQYRDGQDGSGEFHGFLGKDGSLEREGKMGQFSGIRGNMAEGNQFSGFAGDSSGVMGFDQNSMLHGSGVSGGPGGLVSMGALTGKDNMLGGIPSDTVFGTVGGLHAVQGQGSMLNGASIGGSAGGTDLEGFNYNKGVLHGPGVMLGDVGGLHDKDVAAGLYGKDGVLSGVGGGGIEGIAGLHGQTGLLHGAGAGGPGGPGGIAGLYGKDGMLGGAGAGGPGGAGCAAGLYGKDGMLGGVGAGGIEGIAGLYGQNGMLGGAMAVGPGGAGGIAGLYGKDGVLGGQGVGGPGGTGGVAGLYGKDGMLIGAGAGGPGGAGGVAGLYGKDGMLIGAGAGGPGGAGGVAGLYGKDGMLIGAGAGGPGGAGGVAGLYGKDGTLSGVGAGGPGGAGGVAGLYGKEGMLGGAGAGGPGGAGGVAGLYGKDGMLIGAGAGGPGGAGGIAGLYGKDGTLNGAGAGGPGGAGGEAGLYGKDGMLGGAGAGGPGGAGGIAGLYGKDGMLGGAGAGGAGGGVGLYGKDGTLGGVGAGGPGGAGGIAGLYGKDGLLGGAGAGGPGGAGGGVGLYGKDGTLGGVGAGGPGGAGGRAGLSGKDGMLDGEGAGGTGGAGGMAGLYGKDGMLGGAGAGGPGGAGGVAGLYGKDGMLIGAGAGGPGGAGGVAGLYGKDGTLGEVGAGGPGGAGGRAGLYGKDGMVGGAGAGGPGGAGGVAGLYGKDGALGGVGSGGAGGAGGVAGLYGKDGTLIGPGAGGPGRAGGVAGLYGKDGMPGGIGVGGPGDAGIAGGLHCKDGMLPGTDHFGDSGAGDMQGLYTKNGMQSSAGFDGAGNISGLHGKDGRPAGAGIVGFGEGVIGDPYGMEGRLGGIGAGVSGIDWSLSGVPGEDFQNYNQLSGVQAGDRRRQLSDTDASGLISADISRTRDRKGRGGSLLEEDMREPHCRFTEGLFDIHAEKGKSAVLSCSLNNDQLEGTWLKDGFEVTGLEGISVEKNGAIHKLIIDEVQDNHAGKYKFETEGIHTEASLFVEEPPNVDASVLEKLQKEPVVVKAGKNAMVKIPFEGKKPIRASWLKDDGELLDDARIHTDHSDNFTRLSISSTNRKDCGDYKVKLKNDSGSLEATLKLVVLDKPQPPVGPIEVVDTSTSGITIQWKPPKDDGGKPVQRYIIERQQVGRKTWLTLGETNGNSTIFTTSKVEHDKSYYFKVKAVNAEGTSEALESEEVMAATKVFPGPPAPPKIVSANKDAITLSWGPPHKAGNSRISGYIVEKCKKGSNTWTPVSNLPITDKKYTVTDLKEGLQYEFRVAAINAAGAGEASVPSEAVFAREPMKPPGPVRELKVVSTDYTSISLSWKKPESEEESHAKGYIIEMRHSDILKWTQCNALPITTTSYTVRKLKPKEMYFLRVKAVNDGGSSDPVELDTYIQAVPPSVYPKLLINDTMKSFMIVKAGDTIRVRVPFEASPTPEVIWLRDGLSLPYKATIATREGLTQVIIPGAEYSDSGLYTITLQTESGKKETFSFLVQVIDIPESPGPIQLVEKVPDTVTLIWEHSPTEKRGHNLYYMVMKRDTSKGSWELVSDLIYTNKCTVSNFIPGREYYFRVLAKNFMGISDPSETVQPWSVNKAKGKFEVRLPRYKGVNQSQPPRFLVQLKPHIVTLGFDCHMSCAVTGYPVPQVTWYKDGKNLSQDPSFVTKNDFGVCSLVIPGVTPSDEGEFKVVASNALGQAVSRATVTIKASAL
ncbi:immunoglobulin-like and fibronectin type III domain-containing protein 1 isoform X20 [Sphaerodactylus townsendi]|uniref:immunoglobulin-like and fibronectin type III domain-containing protein 1 isoform X20 n=1 Tax=Sphaerodactylus townsendi TaxID=933632 RepID=UPI0020262BE0|nr:immunoglobulin-like and fibronectin type III domain-containing protein 1 isoform X20 [Sphaerodactylus townsendi]